MELLKELYQLLLEIIKDLKSTRMKLILLSYWFNFWVLHLINKGQGKDSLGIAAIGLLAAINGFYFYSRMHQADLEKRTKES